MLFRGVLISQASGRIGDAVASRNAGGAYFRSMGNPNPNPATPEQETIRAAMTAVRADWAAFTAEQRAAWDEFSAGVRRPGRIGTMRSIGGFQEFTRANLPRYYCNGILSTSLATVAEPPNRASVSIGRPVESVACDGGKVTVDWDSLASWNTVTGQGLMVWASPALPGTVNYYRSPMTLVGFIEGGTGADDPVQFTTPDETTAGQCRTFRVRFIGADGTLSDDYWTRAAQT